MFWAYLWGIETRDANYNLCWKLGFEPTYEELKRNMIVSAITINVSFEPTYEELKPNLGSITTGEVGKFWAYLWGIETPSSFTFTSTFILLFSLPMRNWNIPSMFGRVVFS